MKITRSVMSVSGYVCRCGKKTGEVIYEEGKGVRCISCVKEESTKQRGIPNNVGKTYGINNRTNK